jgi:hypothetical protein
MAKRTAEILNKGPQDHVVTYVNGGKSESSVPAAVRDRNRPGGRSYGLNKKAYFNNNYLKSFKLQVLT